MPLETKDGSQLVASSPMTKLSQDASQLQLLSPHAPHGASLKSPLPGDKAFSAFRAPDTMTRASAKKKRATREKQYLTRAATVVGEPRKHDGRPSPAPSPAVSHPDTPVDDVLRIDRLDAYDEPETRSNKKRGLSDAPPELTRTFSGGSSDSGGGFRAGAGAGMGDRRPSPLNIPGGLDMLAPPRMSQSPVLPAGARPSFIDRAQGMRPLAGSGFSLDTALHQSETSRSLCNPPNVRTTDDSDHEVLSRSAESSRTAADTDGCSSGKRFRQTSTDMEEERALSILSSSAPAETPLPDMTPRAKLMPIVDTQDGCQCIDGDALEALIAGRTGHDAYHIIDCRFPFEHEGGCIHSPHTHNIWDPAAIEKMFFPEGHSMVDDRQRTAIIFHCEFSSKRAPKMCKHLRALDRQIVPTSQYPHLCYPEMYILKSGYNEFVETHTHICRPGPLSSGGKLYTEMLDKCWTEQFQRSQAEYQTAWKKLNKRDKKKGSRPSGHHGRASLESSPQAGARNGDGGARRQFRPIGMAGGGMGRARLSLQDGGLSAGGQNIGGAARGMSFASMHVAADDVAVESMSMVQHPEREGARSGGGLFAVPPPVDLRRSSTVPPSMEMMSSGDDER